MGTEFARKLFSPRRPGFPLIRSVLVFLNGRFVPEEKAVVSAFDRGFLYGEGLFETIRVFNGIQFRWKQHLDRLQRGADFLKIKLPFAPKKLLSFALALIEKNEMPDSLLRLTLSRGVGAPGYAPKDAKRPTLVMALRPAPKINHNNQWRLIISSFRLPANDPLAQFKTCNKLPHVLARAEADAVGANEAVLTNTSGFVAEGASSNIFWVRKGILYTPPLAAGSLSGTTRALVFEISSQLKIPARENDIRPKELLRVDGVFLSLSSFGIVEAKSLNGKNLKKSPITARIAQSYTGMLMHSCACNAPLKP